MSDPLAIAAVSAVLQHYFYNLFSQVSGPFGGVPTISSKSPDLVQESLPPNSANQVNLFMHQVTYNPAWRNVGLPSLDPDGKTRLKNPPLALDLHYLLTVYGSEDWQAEGLLGYALMMLNENPVLTRGDITNALGALSGTNTSMLPYLKNSTLADQVELLKITPATLGKEELAWLWTALKADYRPTFPFQVSVVLIRAAHDNAVSLPVLRRSVTATPIQPAQILTVKPPHRQVGAAVGDAVAVTGEFLGGLSRVWLSNPRYGVAFPVALTNQTNTSFTFTVPAGFPAGIYSLVGQLTDSTGAVVQSTNSVSVALAPTLLAQAQTATPVPPPSIPDPYPPAAPGTLQLSAQFSPDAWVGQQVSLSLSSTAPPSGGGALYTATSIAQPFTANAGSLTFQFPPGLPAGPLLGRLTVDGVTSAVQVDWSAHPPTFTGPIVTVTL